MKGFFVIFVTLLIFECNCQFGPQRRPQFGQRPGGQNGNRATPPAPDFDFVSDTVKECLRKCDFRHRSLQCPVIPQLPALANCRSCLRWECASDPFVPGFLNERCEISSYATCRTRGQCPTYTSAYQKDLSQCLTCRDGCISSAQKTEIQNAMKKASSCLQKCSETDRQCMSIPSASCRTCARRQCELAGTRTENCVMRYIQDRRVCTTCPIVNVNIRNAPPRQCACASSCLQGSIASRNAGADQYAYLRFLPIESIKCLSSKCTGVCPDAEAKRQRARSVPETCRRCIEARCPRSRTTPGFDDESCKSQAYAACGIANGCPTLTVQQLAQNSLCLNCQNGCVTEAIKNDVRAKMAISEPDEDQRPFGPPRESSNQGGLRNVGKRTANGIRGQGQGQGNRAAGARRPNGLQSLFSDRTNSFLPESNKICLMTNCESKCAPREVRPDRDDVDAPCRQCIGALCRGGASVPIFDNLKCRNNAHSTCGPLFGCEVLDREVVAQRSACQSCVDSCVPESMFITSSSD